MTGVWKLFSHFNETSGWCGDLPISSPPTPRSPTWLYSFTQVGPSCSDFSTLVATTPRSFQHQSSYLYFDCTSLLWLHTLQVWSETLTPKFNSNQRMQVSNPTSIIILSRMLQSKQSPANGILISKGCLLCRSLTMYCNDLSFSLLWQHKLQIWSETLTSNFNPNQQQKHPY